MAIQDTWKDYRATKATLFWACVGTAALTMIVGFTWGGWVTGGTATQMAEEAAEQASAKLAATVCVERFLSAEDSRTQLASLKEASSWQRDDFITKGGWLKLAGVKDPVSGAAEICAERLAEKELPPAEASANTGTVVQ